MINNKSYIATHKSLFLLMSFIGILLFIGPVNAEEAQGELPFYVVPQNSYDYSTQEIEPDKLSLFTAWEPVTEFDSNELSKSGKFWIRFELPPALSENPALVINAFLEAFEIFNSHQKIYEYPDESEFDYYQSHMIPIEKNDRPGYIYCRLYYSDSAGIGEIDSILVGSKTDLTQAVANSRETIYRESVVDICQGFLLFMTGAGCLMIFLLRFKEKEYPFFSFGFFSLTTGITYLSGIHPLCFINVSPSTYLYIKTISFLLVPVGLFALVENIFGKGLHNIFRRLWQFHLLFTFLAFFLIKLNIDYTYFFLPVLIFNGLLCSLLIFRTDSDSASEKKIKLSFVAFLLLFVSLTLIQFLKNINLISWTYDLFGWCMLLFTFALGHIMMQHYRNTFKKMQTVSLELERNKSEMLELQKEKLSSQLEALKNQLDPHFLFNNLSTLTSIIEENQETAVNFVKELSMIYRYVLQAKVHTLVKLEEELNFINSYKFLMVKRFGENFSLSISISDSLKNFRVVPFCLQLLVENAIKHNIISIKKPLLIEIFTEESNYLVVKNNLQIKPNPAVSTNIGLANIQNRYRLITEKPVSIIKSESEFIVKIPLFER